jgi:hypothetical protein
MLEKHRALLLNNFNRSLRFTRQLPIPGAFQSQGFRPVSSHKSPEDVPQGLLHLRPGWDVKGNTKQINHEPHEQTRTFKPISKPLPVVCSCGSCFFLH